MEERTKAVPQAARRERVRSRITTLSTPLVLTSTFLPISRVSRTSYFSLAATTNCPST
jgi:hypothetical protein